MSSRAVQAARQALAEAEARHAEQQQINRGRSRSQSRPRRSRRTVKETVAALRREHLQQFGMDGPRVHPVQENGKVQARNVRITVRGMMNVYQDGEIVETTDIDETEYVVIKFKTRRDLVDGINQQIEQMKGKVQELEVDSPKKTFYSTWAGGEDGYSQEHMRSVARRPDVVEMYRADPIDNRCLKGTVVNRLDKNDPKQFNCVVEYLYQTYKKKIPTLDTVKVVSIMTEDGDDMEIAAIRGWSIQDVQRFCDYYKISHYVLDGMNRLVHKKISGSFNYPACMYVCEDCHMYPITDPSVRNRIVKTFSERNDRQTGILALENEKKREEAEKNAIKMFNKLPFKEDVDIDELPELSDTVVYYHMLHLKHILLELYMKTKVLYEFKHTGKLVTYIKYDNNVHLFANSNHKSGCDWNTTMEIADKLNLPYKNQSLASLSHEYFVKKYHPKGPKQMRANISKKLKLSILKEQSSQCAHCDKELKKDDKWECDHIVPISCGGDALAQSNLQILCPGCHLEKSRKEAAEMLANIDNSASYYNEATLKIFGEVPINGVIHNFVPLESYESSLSPTKQKLLKLEKIDDEEEEIKVESEEESDEEESDDDDDDRENKVRYLTAKEKTSLVNQKKKKKSLKKQPETKNYKILAGLDINKSRTNILRYGNVHEWNCFSVLNDPAPFDEDVHYDAENNIFLRGFYYVESDNLLPIKGNSWLCVPALEHCLEHKVITMSQIKYVVLSSLGLPADYFHNYVENIMASVENQKHWKLMINSLVGIMGVRKSYHRDFKILLNKKAAAAYILEKQVRGQSITISPRAFDEADESRNEAGELIDPDYYEVREESHFPIFMQVLQQEACELHKIQMLLEKYGGKLVNCNTDAAVALFDSQDQIDKMWKEAQTICWDKEGKVPKYKQCNDIHNFHRMDTMNTESYEFKKPVYHLQKDPNNDDFDALAKRLVDHGKSFQIDAMAGCGKTTLLSKIMDELDKRDEKYLACTPTHKSAKVLRLDMDEPEKSAQTIHKALGALKFSGWSGFSRFGRYKWIIIDEKSMVKESFFLLLSKIKRHCPDTKFIICGDWMQLPPVNDRSATFNYIDSSVVWDLCDGLMMRLSVCRRSDRALFELYADVSKVEVENFPTELYQKNICYLNSTRKAINHYWMRKLAPKHKNRKLLKAHLRAKQSQDTFIYKGLPVIAAVTRSGLGFANAEEFVVTEFDNNNVYLQCIEDKDRILTIPSSDFTYCFQPAYAVTVHRCQGASIGQPFSIWNWESMDDKMKYVALSRSRKLKYINMCSQAQLKALE